MIQVKQIETEVDGDEDRCSLVFAAWKDQEGEGATQVTGLILIIPLICSLSHPRHPDLSLSHDSCFRRR